MTPRQIIAVALRLFAVWLGLQALRTLPSFFTVSAFRSPSYVWLTFMLALTVAAILVLWFFPRTIAGRLVPSPDIPPQPSATPDMWLAMGCTLIGLWTLATTLPRLVYDLVALNAVSSYEDPSQLRNWVLYNLVELAIALWLILGARGVRKTFWWAQNARTRKEL